MQQKEVLQHYMTNKELHGESLVTKWERLQCTLQVAASSEEDRSQRRLVSTLDPARLALTNHMRVPRMLI